MRYAARSETTLPQPNATQCKVGPRWTVRPLVILLNGAFGIGKTTVARLLAKRIPNTALFDPELAGIALQRARKLFRRPVGDFQDISLWRRSVVFGVRASLRFHATVIVPMAFSNLAYLGEIQAGIKDFEPSLFHFCLVAPVEVVRARLKLRGAEVTDPSSTWQYRRASECCIAHQDPVFAEQIPTQGLTAHEIANHLIARLEFHRGAG
jgi:hypothetical protein